MQVKASGRGLHMGANGARQKTVAKVLDTLPCPPTATMHAMVGVAVHGKNINIISQGPHARPSWPSKAPHARLSCPPNAHYVRPHAHPRPQRTPPCAPCDSSHRRARASTEHALPPTQVPRAQVPPTPMPRAQVPPTPLPRAQVPPTPISHACARRCHPRKSAMRARLPMPTM